MGAEQVRRKRSSSGLIQRNGVEPVGPVAGKTKKGIKKGRDEDGDAKREAEERRKRKTEGKRKKEGK